MVATLPQARAGDKKRLLEQEVEQLVVEAKRVGLEMRELVAAIESRWMMLERSMEVSRK